MNPFLELLDWPLIQNLRFYPCIFQMSDSVESDPDDEIPLEETLLICARRGQATIINDILKSRKEGKICVDINCKGIV